MSAFLKLSSLPPFLSQASLKLLLFCPGWQSRPLRPKPRRSGLRQCVQERIVSSYLSLHFFGLMFRSFVTEAAGRRWHLPDGLATDRLRDLHFDGFRTRIPVLGHMHTQHAVLEVRVNLLRIRILGQRETPRE